jgi:hypothetical protein
MLQYTYSDQGVGLFIDYLISIRRRSLSLLASALVTVAFGAVATVSDYGKCVASGLAQVTRPGKLVRDYPNHLINRGSLNRLSMIIVRSYLHRRRRFGGTPSRRGSSYASRILWYYACVDRVG